MKKKILIVFILMGWVACKTLAAPIRVTGFEEGDAKIMNVSKGSSGKKVVAEEGEIIPEGKRYFSVTFVAAANTFMSLRLPIDKIPATATKITMWIKGSQKNKSGFVLYRRPSKADSESGLSGGNWYYNGVGTKVDVSENEWVKYEFRAKDFKWWSPTKKKTSRLMKINEYPYWSFGLKLPKGEKTCIIKFCIDNIEVE